MDLMKNEKLLLLVVSIVCLMVMDSCEVKSQDPIEVLLPIDSLRLLTIHPQDYYGRSSVFFTQEARAKPEAVKQYCKVVYKASEITETMVVNQSAIVTINETSGIAVNFNDVIEGDLNQAVSNFNSISDITIDSLSYSFSNLIGNENASIVSASLKINDFTVSVVSDLNIAQEIDNESVFQITDLNILDQLETSFLNNSSVTLNLSGMAISDEGDVSFEKAIAMQLTASF